MLTPEQQLIDIAEQEVSYLEKKSNSQLDSKTANAGYNNYTKYARDLHKAGYYQASKQGLAWCDMFVDWCFYVLCKKDAKKAQEMIYQSGPYGAGCRYSANYYRKANAFYKTPKVGDQIFFGTSGSESHTGIVYKVTSTHVYTIEGNTSSASGVVANGGGVFKKSYALNYKKIVGYGRPNYAMIGSQETTVKEERDTFNMEINVLRQGDKGADVKAMQLLLIGYGFKMQNNGKTYGADSSFGPATVNAVKAYQKANKLDDDGVCGPKTWAKLLGQD